MSRDAPMFDAQRRSGYSSSRRTRTLGILLACAVGLMLSSLALSNVTEEGPATRSIARSLAILTEVDAFLDAEYAELRERASAMAGEVTLADFPVAVSFTAEEVLATDQAGFRELLLSRSAQRVYDDGASVLREGRKDQTGLFSTENVLRRGLELLRPTPHRIFFGLTVALAIIALVLALGLGLVASAYGRLLAIGLSIFLAAAPSLALAFGVRFALRVAADGADDYLSQEFLQLGQELAWAPVRNGIIFSAGAAVLLGAGSILTRWSDARNL